MSIDIRGMAPLIQVFDMPTSVAFYRDILGFKLLTTSQPDGSHFDWCLLEFNGGQLMLNTAYERDRRPPKPDPTRISMHHDMCFYFGCPDPDQAFDHLRERGISANPPKTAHYGFYQLYFKDPDGYEICFHRPARQAVYNEWVARYHYPPRKVEEA